MKIHDEYNWETYTNIYSNQIKTENDSDFIIKNAKVIGDKIEWNGDIIHPNIINTMDLIAKYKPSSVFECGFGGGHNLYSINKLFPDIKIGGVELLQSQVDFGRTYFKIPDSFYENDLAIGDWLTPDLYKAIMNKYEFIFTNAVIMHLNTERAITFMKNIISMNPKYISIVEGTPNHDWNELYESTNILNIYSKLESNHPDFRNFILK